MDYSKAGTAAQNTTVQIAGTRVPQVQGAQNDLINSVGVLEETTDVLVQRLCNMLTPCAPETGNKNPSAPTPVRAPHAEQLDGLTNRLRSVNGKLQDLLARYEG